MSHAFPPVTFLLGASRLAQLPPDDRPEIAFAGRSNAGKSSAINALTGRVRLARISKTPGRTREINFFAVEPDWRLVDLPGYGFARVPESVRARWASLVEGYLSRRRSLVGVVLLMDVRHPLTPLDRQLIDWTAPMALPVRAVLTKADKLGRGASARALAQVRGCLEASGERVSAQLLSATRREGVDTLEAWVRARLDAARG